MDGDAGLDLFEGRCFVLDEKHRERDDIGNVEFKPLGVDLLESFNVMEAEILLMPGQEGPIKAFRGLELIDLSQALDFLFLIDQQVQPAQLFVALAVFRTLLVRISPLHSLRALRLVQKGHRLVYFLLFVVPAVQKILLPDQLRRTRHLLDVISQIVIEFDLRESARVSILFLFLEIDQEVGVDGGQKFVKFGPLRALEPLEDLEGKVDIVE